MIKINIFYNKYTYFNTKTIRHILCSYFQLLKFKILIEFGVAVSFFFFKLECFLFYLLLPNYKIIPRK